MNAAVKKVFGKDASKVPAQTLANAPKLDTSKSRADLTAMKGSKDTVEGFNHPDMSQYLGGPIAAQNGTIYVSSDIVKSGDMPEIFGTYAHELGNLLDMQINGPHGAKVLMVIHMIQSPKIQVNKLKRPCSLSDRTPGSWRLPGLGFCQVLVCVLALLQFFPSTALAGQDTDCKDTMRVELHMADRASVKAAEARGFLWQHWSEKKCGELFLTTWSREGVRTDSRYKIGLVQDAMLLTVNLSRTDDPSTPVDGLAVPASGSIKRTAPVSTSYLAYSMERVKPEVPYDVATAKVIESTESFPPSKYRLRFKDKDGKVITDF